MRLIAFDTETYLITEDNAAPLVVAGGFYFGDTHEVEIYLRDEFLARFWELAHDVDNHFVAHNMAFDAVVMMAAGGQPYIDLLFSLLEDGRMHCTYIREKMRRLRLDALTVYKGGKSKMSLAALVEDYFKIDVSASKSGEDVWRLRYAELDGVPVEEWPEEAVMYLAEDVRLCANVFMAQDQTGDLPEDPRAEMLQTRAAVALQLMTAEGIRTDVERAESVAQALSEAVVEANKLLVESGLKEWTKKKGELVLKKNMARIRDMLANDGCELMYTEKGAISTSAEALRRAKAKPLLALAGIGNAEKLLTTYIPALRRGVVHSGYDPILNTNRTSSFRPNIQNMPRKGGIRECFIPSEGTYFVSIDYDTLELRTWAQVCILRLGFSDMATALREGKDPHSLLGAQLLGVEYETFLKMLKSEHEEERTEAKDARQSAKGVNFGKPGGLGDTTMQLYLHNMGIELSTDEVKALGIAWMRTWREARRYFDNVNATMPFGKEYTSVEIPGTFGLIRGKATYTAACNTPFQGLAAAGAKNALWLVACACYVDRDSPAFGSRPVAFIHDEILAEVPIATAHEASFAIRDCMIAGMAEFVPDVPISASPALMDRWYKAAEPVYEEGTGRLLPWRPPVQATVEPVAAEVADLLPEFPADEESSEEGEGGE